MRRYQIEAFGLENLRLTDVEPARPGPGQVCVDVRALSLNYRDLLVLTGQYNPRLRLPATPVSDGAGVVTAVGDGVASVRAGDRVVSHFVAGWTDGPFRAEYVATTLGTPGPGLASEQAVLPEMAVLPIPEGLSFAEAATLPIAALTAWSALVTEGRLAKGQTVLTLGTGGVSIFALQFAKAMGAKVILTTSSDQKAQRARALGADEVVNYRESPDWDKAVLERTGGLGADITVENGGAATLNHSLKATRAGGVVAMLGAITGLQAQVNLSLVLMRRIHIAGIMVDSRASFAAMNRFLVERGLRPVIDRRFPFEQLRDALAHMQSGKHFGKIVVERG